MVRHARTAVLRRTGVITFLTSLVAIVRTSWACPSCPTSLTVWDEVLGPDFDKNLLVSLVPFLLVGWIARQFELHTIRDER